MIPKTFAPENEVKPFVIMKNTNSPTRNDSKLAHHNTLASQENYEHRHHRSLKPGASKLPPRRRHRWSVAVARARRLSTRGCGFVPAPVSYRRE